MGLSREEFLKGVPERVWEEMEVPGWGTMSVRGLDALELVDLAEYLDAVPASVPRVRGTEVMARVAVRCLATPEGDRLLTDDDLPTLLRKPGALDALPVIFATANRINKIIVAKDDPEKNSEPSVNGDSPTG